LAYVEIYKCTACGTEIGRGPGTKMGSPFVACEKCGTPAVLSNNTEWDLLSRSTRSDLVFGAVMVAVGPAALLGFVAFAGGGAMLGHKVKSDFFAAHWPVLAAIIGGLAAVFLTISLLHLRSEIRASRERLRDPGYRRRLEALAGLRR
jgi:hypothetical protein